ncbi:MAG: Antibiotic biosynthesis monooxygenase [Actinomycetia bacterium]|jgi:quinol monooxygenase YgiN|nr:Antibiotic biosynthesis monooxygenase [Actinomycetes bacterium]
MSFVLVVRMTALEGKEEEAVAAMHELAEATRKEPGNELYIPSRDPENPRSLLFYEQYADKAAFEAHGASDHFKELGPGKLFTLVEDGRERSFYETL